MPLDPTGLNKSIHSKIFTFKVSVWGLLIMLIGNGSNGL